MPAPTTFEIGANLAGVVTLASIGVVDPETRFNDYPATVRRQDGMMLGLGNASAIWRYGFLRKDQYDALRVYCATVGAAVCIATLNNDMEFARYNGFMEMPTEYVMRNTDGRQVYIDVEIRFNGLVAAE